jgi:hypothetical protein
MPDGYRVPLFAVSLRTTRVRHALMVVLCKLIPEVDDDRPHRPGILLLSGAESV